MRVNRAAAALILKLLGFFWGDVSQNLVTLAPVALQQLGKHGQGRDISRHLGSQQFCDFFSHFT